MATELISYDVLLDDLRGELRGELLGDLGGGVHRRRRLLGITGPPGAGKSTLADRLAGDLGERLAVCVPMDGFHLADEILRGRGQRHRKGAPDTFDAAGFAALLHRVRGQRPGDPVIFAPRFDRDLEEPIGSAIPVPAVTPLVITEGNYLLLDDPAWRPVRDQLDEVWYLEVPPPARHQRLIDRRLSYGLSQVAAEAWTYGSDEDNARLIAALAGRADRVIQLTA